MVRTTTTTSGEEGHTPDVMEPISVEALHVIASARAKIIELLEMCDEHLSGAVKTAFKNRIRSLREAFDALQEGIEQLMEIGEPAAGALAAPYPEILQAVQAIEALGHEARLWVVDWTLYKGIYPYMAAVSSQGQE
ncbi:MAG: hypothetical protein AB1665_05260 [Candidatus Thermoplasmatota archaeon]